MSRRRGMRRLSWVRRRGGVRGMRGHRRYGRWRRGNGRRAGGRRYVARAHNLLLNRDTEAERLGERRLAIALRLVQRVVLDAQCCRERTLYVGVVFMPTV